MINMGVGAAILVVFLLVACSPINWERGEWAAFGVVAALAAAGFIGAAMGA